MQNIEEDYIYEVDIENIIPARRVNYSGFALLTIMIGLCGFFVFSFMFPCPKVLSGTVSFEENRQTAKLFLVAESTGEIQKGQIVRIYVDNYPLQDYGFLQGNVVGFGNQGYPNEKGLYCVLVELNCGWKTSCGYVISDNIHLQGKGEIVIKEQNLLKILITSIYNLFN